MMTSQAIGLAVAVSVSVPAREIAAIVGKASGLQFNLLVIHSLIHAVFCCCWKQTLLCLFGVEKRGKPYQVEPALGLSAANQTQPHLTPLWPRALDCQQRAPTLH